MTADGAARPAHDPEIAHVPALDGIRGVAVTAVLLYHGGVSWAQGGFIGVEAFFVLSGFLITSLLVAEWQRSDTIRLRRFWARRARRLLPALFCVVAAVGFFQWAAGPTYSVHGFSGDGLATLLYFGNWHEILTNNNYFVQSGPVSPLEHTWSLAIEEQFYVVWPLILLLVLRLATRRATDPAARRRRMLGGLAAGSAVGALASAVAMAVLYQPGNSARVYYGTDTRAQALLAGAALAFTLAYLRVRSPQHRRTAGPVRVSARAAVAVLGLAGAALVAAAIALTSGTTSGLYRFGFLGLDAAVAAVILSAVVLPASPVGRILSVRPLRAVGEISYGIYLWHFPLFLWLTPSAVGVNGSALLAVRLAVVGTVSLVSYVVVEQPIRRGRLPRRLVVPLAPTGAACAVAAVMLGSSAGITVLTTTVAPPPAAGAPHPRSVATATPQSWAGTGPACEEQLADTPQYFEAAPPESKYFGDVMQGLSMHTNDFGDRQQVSFRTCPPKRVLFVGDSVALTLGLGMLHGEQQYGIELAVAPLEGCAFNTDGLLYYLGSFVSLPPECATEDQRWLAAAESFHPDAVVVELGWRDSFDWQVDGQTVHLGDAAFDAAVRSGMEKLVREFERAHAVVLLLSVPWADQPTEPDGSQQPATLPVRHQLINAELTSVASEEPGKVRVLDIDRYVSPGNHYDRSVDGQLCRFDGLHFTEYCSRLLQPYVLGEVRQMLQDEAA